MADFKPTDEQLAALKAYRTGGNLIIEAGAGTGKTATLELLAESDHNRRGQYIAFNRAIVQEAQERMPGHVSASTAHSLAYRSVGHRYSHRLNAPRMRSWEIAQLMGIGPQAMQVDGKQKMLSESYLAGLVMRAITNFCQSADPRPMGKHVPYVTGIDLPTTNGDRTYDNNNRLQQALRPFLERTWADIQDPNGRLPFRHEHYLKMWQLSDPYIPADVIYFDEAQDVSPVLAAIVDAQRHAQRVYVGDSNQAIYEWLGAIDALSQLEAAERTVLTQSFRFGPEVATVANRVLATLPTSMRIRGTPSLGSVVGPVAEPDAILCRTNAEAVQRLLLAQTSGIRGHLVGGGSDVASFARAAERLQREGNTWHQDLACFSSWGEVQEYVLQDAQGDDLKLLVDLVDRFGARSIVDALDQMPREQHADLVLSTAHKSKGRQWPAVKLASDFPPDTDDTSEEERRLLYVAVTRARAELDVSAYPWLCGEVAYA